MSKTADFSQALNNLKNWTPFLLKESGLPGPRANLELAGVVAEQGDIRQFEKFLAVQAKANTPEEFIVFCGVMGLGQLAAQGEHELFARLRTFASDSRWRIREAVAAGLQRVGDENMPILLKEMKGWIKGNWLEKRAAAAALAEPRLLKEPKHVKQVLQILDKITASMETTVDSNDEQFKVLRQGMAYCWSVAIAAFPEQGKPALEKWLTSRNPDIQWIIKENLKKNRLIRMDEKWVKACQARL